MAKNNLIITIIVAVLVGGLGFYGGTLYQKNKQGNLAGGRMNRGFAPQQGGAARQGNALGTRPVSGEITNIDNESITIGTQNNGSKLVIFSDSTKINKMSEGTKSDLATGIQITVMGTENSDGSITAQNISIGTGIFRGILNGRQPGQSPPESTEQ